jgi:hypothetical protein
MEEYEIDNVIGCDVERAKAIICTKMGVNNLVFEVRELQNGRTRPRVDVSPGTVILWTKNGVVHKSARFSLSFEDDEE